MIKLSDISVSFGEKNIFEKLNLQIYDGERIGIIGNNGSGKSTLVNIIAGEVIPNGGVVELKGTTIGYLKQISQYDSESVRKIIYDSVNYNSFMEVLKRNYFLRDIDLENLDWNSLSGGEKTKFMLAYIISMNPNTLILDEPTNHLDIEAIDYIKKFIDEFIGTVIIVSHDRNFLDSTVSKIIEIEAGKVTEYYGNYSLYKDQKALEVKTAKSKYEQQRKLEERIDEQVDELMKWSNKGEKSSRSQGGMRSDSKYKGRQTDAQVSAAKLSKAAKNKIARLNKLREDFVDMPFEQGKIHYAITSSDIGSKVLVEIDEVTMRFDDRELFKNVNLIINRGDKIAIVGKNGSGKSTLIDIITGIIEPTTGNVHTSQSLKTEVIHQDVFDLDADKTIMDIAKEGDRTYLTKFLTNLVNMNLDRSFFDKKIGKLSLGERMRVKLTKMILSDFNFLILDEPTNHLDIESREQLEYVLSNFKGTVLIASHDRDFLKNIANKIWLIEDCKIKEIEKEKLLATDMTKRKR